MNTRNQPIRLIVVIEIRAHGLRAAWGQVLKIQRLIACQPQLSLGSTANGMRDLGYPLTVSQVRRTEDNGPLTLERLRKLWEFFSHSQKNSTSKSEVKILRIESGGGRPMMDKDAPGTSALTVFPEDLRGEQSAQSFA